MNRRMPANDASRHAPLTTHDLSLLLAIVALAIMPTLRIRYGMLDSTVAMKGAFGFTEALFALSVFARVKLHDGFGTARRVWVTLAAVWLALALAAVAASDHLAVALVRQAEWVGHILFGYAMFLVVRERPEFALYFVRLVIAGLLLYSMEFIVFRLTIPWPEGFDWATGIPGYSNVRHLGYFAMAALPLSYWLLQRANGGRGDQVLGFAGMSLAWFFLFWAGGRGPWVALAAGAGLAIFARPPVLFDRRMVAWLTVTAAIGLLAALALAVPGLGLGRLADRAMDFSLLAGSHGRIVLWREAVSLLGASPALGLGPDGYLFRPGAGAGYVHPHNLPLQAALEWGIAGTAAAAVLAGGLAARIWRGGQAPLLWVVWALLALSMVDGTLYHAQPMMIFAACVAVVAANSTSVPVIHGRARWPSLAAAVCALLFTVHLISVHHATSHSAGSGSSVLAAFPSGFADTRSVAATWQRLLKCAESTPAPCARYARAAARHSRPPDDTRLREAAAVIEQGDAQLYLQEHAPWRRRSAN